MAIFSAHPRWRKKPHTSHRRESSLPNQICGTPRAVKKVTHLPARCHNFFSTFLSQPMLSSDDDDNRNTVRYPITSPSPNPSVTSDPSAIVVRSVDNRSQAPLADRPTASTRQDPSLPFPFPFPALVANPRPDPSLLSRHRRSVDHNLRPVATVFPKARPSAPAARPRGRGRRRLFRT